MKQVKKYDWENYLYDIDNMQKFDDDEYLYHLWDIMENARLELEGIECGCLK